MLWLTAFQLYFLPLSIIIKEHCIHFHFYVSDTKLYLYSCAFCGFKWHNSNKIVAIKALMWNFVLLISVQKSQKYFVLYDTYSCLQQHWGEFLTKICPWTHPLHKYSGSFLHLRNNTKIITILFVMLENRQYVCYLCWTIVSYYQAVLKVF